ncbi:response regulator transcription factor [Nonomuraea sp. NPDC055795]
MIRVLIVDDHELIRRGLRKLLDIEDDIEVVGEAGDGLQALAALAVLPRHRPDVVLVDARMPTMDGVQLIIRLAEEHPEVAALVLSTFEEDEYIFGALRAGARGYLLKDCSPEDLVGAIRKTYQGETVLGGPVATRLVAELGLGGRGDPVVHGHDKLSGREREVARMIAAGASNREIAAALRLSKGTVKNHVSSMLRKLGVRDRTRLALYLSDPSKAWRVRPSRS